MYNKTIKKSIAFITLLSIVFSCFYTLASSTSSDENFTVTFPDYNLSADYIIDTHPDPSDPNHYFITKYRVSVTPWIYFKNTGYVNGRFYIPVTVSINNPNGSNIPDDIKIEPKSLLSENIYSTQLWATSPNSGSFYIYTYFNNYYNSSINNWVPIEPFYFEFSIQCTTNSENNIQLSFVTGDFSDTCTYSNSPSNTGLADIITDSIVNALGNTYNINFIIELLENILYEEMQQNIAIGSTNSLLGTIINNLSALQGYVDGVEGILTNIYNKIVLLYDNIDTIIDTISWVESTSYNFVGISSTLNGTYSKSNLNNVTDAYFKFSNPTNMLPELLYKYNIPYRLFGDFNIEIFYGGSLQWKMSFDYYFDCGHQYCPLYLYNVSTYDSTSNFVIHISKKNGETFNCTYLTAYEHNLRYISSSDIEYFFIVQYFVMYDLLHKGETDKEAENELSQAAQQMEEAAAAMDVTKPAANSVLPESLVSGDIAVAQGTLFSWLNNNYILSILIACFTIALIGFVIYGKSG